MKMSVIEGTVEAKNARIAVIAARFNSFVVENLVDGALDTLKRIGQVAEENVTLVRVPGAYELPMIASQLAQTQQYDAIVAVGAVIRGQTPHFDYVAGECGQGLAKVMSTYQIPVGFGVLTTDTIEQAVERAGCKVGNKGCEVALSTLEMINIMRQINRKELV